MRIPVTIEGETRSVPILSVGILTDAGVTFHDASDATPDESSMPLRTLAGILEHGFAAGFARVGGRSGEAVPRDCGDMS